MGGFAFAVTSALKGFLQLLATLAPSIPIDFAGDLPKVNGMELGVRFSNDNLDFLLGKGIRLADVFGNPTVETLGFPPDEAFTLILSGMMINLLGIFASTITAFFFKSRALTLEKALTWTILMKTLVVLAEILMVENTLNSIQDSRNKVLITEFLGELHFGWVLGLFSALFGMFGVILGSGLEFFTDIYKDQLYQFFFAKFVDSEIPLDKFWLINEEGTGLRIGILFGSIEGSLLIKKLEEAKDIFVDLLTSGLVLINLDKIRQIKRNLRVGFDLRDKTSISVQLGLRIMLGVFMAVHLILSAYWLKRTNNYL